MTALVIMGCLFAVGLWLWAIFWPFESPESEQRRLHLDLMKKHIDKNKEKK